MALFEQETPAQKAAKLVRSRVVSAMSQFALQYKTTFDFIWRNRDGLTAQEILSEIGTDGAELFEKSAATKDYILSVNAALLPEDYRSPLAPVTINQDGTVTVEEI